MTVFRGVPIFGRPSSCQGSVGIKPTAKKTTALRAEEPILNVFRPEGGGPFLPGVLYTRSPGTQADTT